MRLLQMLPALLLVGVACTEETPVTKDCRLVRLGDFTQFNYDSISYHTDGTIANVWRKQAGGEGRFEYRRFGNNLSIFQSTSQITNYPLCTIEFDDEGNPIARNEHGLLYERYYYQAGRLVYKTWPSKDSIVFTYADNSHNPQSRTFYRYEVDSKIWSVANTITYTFDDRPNPLQGLILPIENWNLEFYFFDNNCTGYTDGSNHFSLSYEYNNKDLPIARTLTFTGFNELRGFDYDCD